MAAVLIPCISEDEAFSSSRQKNFKSFTPQVSNVAKLYDFDRDVVVKIATCCNSSHAGAVLGSFNRPSVWQRMAKTCGNRRFSSVP